MEKFVYLDVRQRGKEWFDARMGRVTASRLPDWLAVSKAAKTLGEPLKSRLDYERELWYERKLGVSFNNYVSEAMLDGQDYEDFARRAYARIKGANVREAGCWANDRFVASPDGLVFSGESENLSLEDAEGLLEIKVVRDNTFTEIVLTGVPDKHWTQIQGQLWASGLPWCDYVALNLNSKRLSIWRVERNEDFIAKIAASLETDISVEDVDLKELHDVSEELAGAVIEPAILKNLKEESWT